MCAEYCCTIYSVNVLVRRRGEYGLNVAAECRQVSRQPLMMGSDNDNVRY